MKALQKYCSKVTILIVLLLLTTISVSAQSYRLRAYELSYKVENDWGGWSDWSDWSSCNIDISFNLDNSRILIFSKETQDYSISNFLGSKTDANGESQVMRCVDDDGLVCTIRLRTQYNPKGLQLYIEYSDMVWVYNVERY